MDRARVYRLRYVIGIPTYSLLPSDARRISCRISFFRFPCGSFAFTDIHRIAVQIYLHFPARACCCSRVLGVDHGLHLDSTQIRTQIRDSSSFTSTSLSFRLHGCGYAQCGPADSRLISLPPPPGRSAIRSAPRLCSAPRPSSVAEPRPNSSGCPLLQHYAVWLCCIHLRHHPKGPRSRSHAHDHQTIISIHFHTYTRTL